jgi:hypothetical protein
MLPYMYMYIFIKDFLGYKQGFKSDYKMSWIFFQTNCVQIEQMYEDLYIFHRKQGSNRTAYVTDVFKIIFLGNR